MTRDDWVVILGCVVILGLVWAWPIYEGLHWWVFD